MKRLYYENQYIKEFNAKVIDIKDINNKLHIALDKTAFFPGGGGQEKDRGKINNYKVVEVYEDEEFIYHVVEKDDYLNISNNEVDMFKELLNREIKNSYNIDISLGEEVECSIDFNHRLDGMHQHLGQHILSGTFFKLFGANTVSIHLGKEISTVDIIGDIDDEKINEAEIFVNKIIKENLKVNSFVPKEYELENLNLRRDLPNTDKEIRVLEIEGLDINACCGVHPNNTLELRLIKIKKHEKNKENTRIEFLAGDRAINDTLKEEKLLKEISILLSSKEEETIKSIENLKEEVTNLRIRKKLLEENLIKIEEEKLLKDTKRIGDYNLICIDNSKEELDYLRKLTNRLIVNEKTIVMFIKSNREKINVILGVSKDIKNIEAGKLIRNSLSIINGKGGGSKFLAEAFGSEGNLKKFKSSIIEMIELNLS
ncbi:DHHA1 domain-containing protein [Clostridium sp.]|uniref:alanyl-tRNA editing protein n=1 Tax=Clostridium sp. TaxID=1506 RepID=UPI00261099E3|nr:DHHA1 domain-containing protein [Clostridium sp.]